MPPPLAYEQVLAANADDGEPAPDFDVHLLGMGGEGHINSLFPHTPAVRETDRLVVGVSDSPKPPPRRITLTLPAVQRSREVWLVVSGEAKADAVAAAVGGARPMTCPPRARWAAKRPCGCSMRKPQASCRNCHVENGGSVPSQVCKRQIAAGQKGPKS